MSTGIKGEQVQDGVLNSPDLAPGALSADVTGRAIVAANFVDAATFLAKFANASVDISAGANKVTGALAVASGGTGGADAATARTNLGLAIGTNVQAFDAGLLSLAALATVADRIAYSTAADTWAESPITAAGRALIDDADAAAQRTTLGLAIGTNVQAFDATLLSLAALGTAADRVAYTTGVDTWAETPLTAAGRALIDDADAAAQRTTLGLAIGTNVQAFDAGLASLAALPTVADRFAYSTAADVWAEATLTAAGRAILDDADAAAQRTTLGVPATADVQPVDADLTAIAALAGTGILAHTGAGAYAERTITGSATVAVTNGTGVAGNPTLALVADGITGEFVDQTADATVGPPVFNHGIDVIVKIVLPNEATDNHDFILPAVLGNIQIIDAWAVKTGGASAAADSVQLQTAGSAANITNAIVLLVADETIVRAGTLNDAAGQIAAGGVLRVRHIAVGGPNNACDLYVRVIKRA